NGSRASGTRPASAPCSVRSATSFGRPPCTLGLQLSHDDASALAGMGRRLGDDDVRGRSVKSSLKGLPCLINAWGPLERVLVAWVRGRLTSPAMNAPAIFSRTTDEWCTPKELFAALTAEFQFATDAAATRHIYFT